MLRAAAEILQKTLHGAAVVMRWMQERSWRVFAVGNDTERCRERMCFVRGMKCVQYKVLEADEQL